MHSRNHYTSNSAIEDQELIYIDNSNRPILGRVGTQPMRSQNLDRSDWTPVRTNPTMPPSWSRPRAEEYGSAQPYPFEVPFNDPSMEPRPLAPDNANAIYIAATRRKEDSPFDILDLVFDSKGKTSNDKLIRDAAEASVPFPIGIIDGQAFGVHDKVTCAKLPYQDTYWYDNYEKLVQFKKEHGHCRVPTSYPKDRILARWVKRQRYRRKRHREGKGLALGREHTELLESIGFVWDIRDFAWEKRFEELASFRRRTGHCRVCLSDNADMATWIKTQRRRYKALKSGRSSGNSMTTDRINKLESLGFVWNQRGGL